MSFLFGFWPRSKFVLHWARGGCLAVVHFLAEASVEVALSVVFHWFGLVLVAPLGFANGTDLVLVNVRDRTCCLGRFS